ncbi:hypothetical protein EUX98_g5687 [Antrodiella citrinella]|uniref:Mitochondrial import inner membrane translocase subunit TIM54 n=1 Tax=Antrodiella citrinella TaxID=2447956 RepID=A0A4S4MQU8_9APHY|nr:hypothetical protein EUX98_g5687 [Antrodiella citrinella]
MVRVPAYPIWICKGLKRANMTRPDVREVKPVDYGEHVQQLRRCANDPLSISGMSTAAGDSKFPTPKPPQSGIKTVLQYTGIPPSWLDKRPSLPSRNWLIFLSVTSTVLGYYCYDRTESKRIRQVYVDRVKHLADAPLHSLACPRKVTVYGSKWPDDEDHDRCMKYFRKYVKPIFVAAAVDYEMVSGRRHGDLANRIAEDIKARRRLDAGIDQSPPNPMNLPTLSLEQLRRQELEGGIVIVGRPSFKEYMTGLKRGWTESLEKVDKEEMLAMELGSDGRFDEPSEPDTVPVDLGDIDDEPIPTVSKLAPSKSLSPAFTAPHLRAEQSHSPASSSSSDRKVDPASMIPPPTSIPPHPPFLLVAYLNRIGMTQIPIMIWDFFNERERVRAGAEAAYALIQNETRPFQGPPAPNGKFVDSEFADGPSPAQPYQFESDTDLDFDKAAEPYFGKSLTDFVSSIEKARTSYYKELPARLETARALARRIREPTKDEVKFPPLTEVELRAERLKKELRWRNDVAGWDVIKPETEVAWDERFRDVLKVFIKPTSLEEEREVKSDSS